MQTGGAAGQTHTSPHEVAQEDTEAAKALLELNREGVFALRRHLNRHDGKLVPAVKALMQHAVERPLESTQTQADIAKDESNRLRKHDLDAALTLIKLSGQSRADSKAGLALLRLRRECSAVLAWEQQKRAEQKERAPLAQLAEEKKDATERFLAFKKFHEQYPAVLRTSRRMNEGKLS